MTIPLRAVPSGVCGNADNGLFDKQVHKLFSYEKRLLLPRDAQLFQFYLKACEFMYLSYLLALLRLLIQFPLQFFFERLKGVEAGSEFRQQWLCLKLKLLLPLLGAERDVFFLLPVYLPFDGASDGCYLLDDGVLLALRF